MKIEAGEIVPAPSIYPRRPQGPYTEEKQYAMTEWRREVIRYYKTQLGVSADSAGIMLAIDELAGELN